MALERNAECNCVDLAQHRAEVRKREAIANALEQAANANHLLLSMVVLDAMVDAVMRVAQQTTKEG